MQFSIMACSKHECCCSHGFLFVVLITMVVGSCLGSAVRKRATYGICSDDSSCMAGDSCICTKQSNYYGCVESACSSSQTVTTYGMCRGDSDCYNGDKCVCTAGSNYYGCTTAVCASKASVTIYGNCISAANSDCKAGDWCYCTRMSNYYGCQEATCVSRSG
jgi:hypothetical protein